MSADLWSPSAAARLKSARTLSPDQLEKVHRSLVANCPVVPWPHGNGTVINPLLVTLGVSPGGSPEAGDEGAKHEGGHALPTSGIPHPGSRYRDTAGYWDKVRYLVKITLTSSTVSDEDALSLFGNMNLDPGQSGDSRNVRLKPAFTAWVLNTIRNGLRPRFLIMLGLTTHLRENPETVQAISRTFPGFDLKKPRREVRFAGYTEKSLRFREWDFSDPGGGKTTIVIWPQHPSRAPFTNTSLWEASCLEFAERHKLPQSVS